MRPGGGKAKGSNFERLVGQRLALWVSNGERADLFARNVLSGGSFTNAEKRGSKEMGTPGDLMANHPMAFDFLRMFCIECKHMQDLNFESFLFDSALDASFLGRTYTGIARQANKLGAHGMLIARQNRRPIIVIVSALAGESLMHGCGRFRMQHHFLHNGRLMMCLFDTMMQCVNPYKAIAHLRDKDLPNVFARR